nr:hypothetical protein [Tautonia marina]
MRRWKTLLAACAAVVVGGSSGVSGAETPQVGQRYPDFVLPSIEGGAPVSLSQFRGKKVLLIQFASW